MRCASCGFENPKGMSFCGQCGTSLTPSCPQCGFVNPAAFAFCGKCGSPLATPPAGKSKPRSAQQTEKRAKRRSAKTPASQEPRVATSEAERRQLTVMFCDLVDSTVLSQRLDPEELREVVRAYQETCTTVIRRYDGHIAQHLGDGLLVYFGYPVAHEDDAQRAGQAGLEIVQAIREQGAEDGRQARRQPLQVRIGIHTGLVVIGEIGSSEKREQLALGETPNLAARIQGQANPNEVMMSAATYRLVEGLFECENRGQPELKGVATPLTLYRVVKEGEAQSRFQVAVRAGLTPLIGREHEVGLLQERWMQAKGGAGQIVLLSGEAGIGKSRLVQTLKEQVLAEGATRVEFRCSPYHVNSAFYPLIEHLQQFLQFHREESPSTKVAKLQQALAQYRFPQADTLPLLAAFLSLPAPAGVPPLTLSPQKQKQKTQEALVAWLVEEAEKAAVYCPWEDLHWADPSTLEVLTLFLEQVPTTRLLAVLTYRPEFTPPWRPRAHLTQLTLTRLGRSQSAAMVEQVTGGKALPAEVLRQIVAKTDGVPLFVEELTKMVLESGFLRETGGRYELTGPLPPLAIPSTLQDSLMARLDRLTTTREIAQLGATLGREFSYELLQAVASADEATLQQGLRQLVEAELLYQRGIPPQATYFFKHALVQDTAYQSLLKSKRQQYHQQIAHVLEERFAELKESQPELVAHHYTEAGLSRQAIPYWEQAGQRASQRGANAEAVNHITTALELLKTLPDTPACAQQELPLQLTLGALRMATHGFAAPEVEQAYRRAQELCEQTGDREQVFTALNGLTNYYAMRAEHQTARALADQMLASAQEAQDSGLLIAAHRMQATTRLWVGEFLATRAHLEQGIALYDPQRHRALTFRYGQNLIVSCRLMAHQALWILGYPDQALQRTQEALTLAQEFSHANTLGYGLACLPQIHYNRGEWQAAQEGAEACVTFAAEAGLPYFVAQMTIFWGAALAKQGRYEEGITKMRQGLAAQRATGGRILQQLWLALQVEAYIETGRFEEGWTALEEAMTIRPTYGDRYWEAELYRLKGELLLAQEGSRLQPVGFREKVEEAEECFFKALETTRELSGKSFELRAATSLARLWQRQGKMAEARSLLAEIYGWFTEGFDTKDLQEAKVLLEELT